MTRPDLALRDCNHCWRFQYIEEATRDDRNFQEFPGGKVRLWRGEPLKRPKTSGPPCCYPKGCPKGHIDAQKSFSAKNRRAYQHYMQCRAVGRFPEDAIVEQNAGIVYRVEQGIERARSDQMNQLVRSMAVKVR